MPYRSHDHRIKRICRNHDFSALHDAESGNMRGSYAARLLPITKRGISSRTEGLVIFSCQQFLMIGGKKISLFEYGEPPANEF